MRKNTRILIATSAADEGFDLQVADRVVHWDISASPAVLMQRNGRVARLGQRSDVRAYYLILEGTHEERRDTRLQMTFADLGIEDESLQNRILGSLEDDELERLHDAIELANVQLIGNILRDAATDNHRMEEELGQLSEQLTATAVLDRNDLCTRLAGWQKLGLPETLVEYEIREETWDKPIFGEKTVVEPAVSMRAKLRRERIKREVVFDPEFIVFGDCADDVSLAGLRPWTKKETKHGKEKLRPDSEADLLGDLLSDLVRLPRADFGRADADDVARVMPKLAGVEILLFCSHPILEDETEWSDVDRPYLNCYAFFKTDENGLSCRSPEGMLASEVQLLIRELEAQAFRSDNLPQPTRPTLDAYVAYSDQLREWLATVTKFGGHFLDEKKYFVPVPVALFVCESGLLREVPAT